MADIVVPLELEGAKAVVRAWLKKVGDTVAADEPVVELETDKVAQEVPAPVAGVLAEILMRSDEEAEPGAVLGRITVAGEGREAPERAEAESGLAVQGEVAPVAAPPSRGTAQTAPGALSPAVKSAMRDTGIDPATLDGSGRGGRVTRADMDAAASARSTTPAEGVRSVPHDRMRLAIAQNMLASVTTAPHVTAVFECDFSAVMAHRAASKAAFEADGASLTYTAYLVSAAAQAMAAAPAINSRWFADRLELYDDVNVGVGTALGEKGLVVPVVRRAQALSLLEIAQALTDQTARARADQLTPADTRGGTFTISNHGVSGSLLATPIIINQPQSAILGVGKLEKRVVVRTVDGADAMEIRPMAYVSLTIDHRVVDAHQTNAWLSRFVDIMETWSA